MAGGAPGPGRGKGAPVQTAGGVVVEKPLTDKERELALKEAEIAAGLRCGGCGERVSSGFEFVVLTAGRHEGRVWSNYRNMVACPGLDGCDFAAEAAAHAVAMRNVRQRFLDTEEMRAKIDGLVKRAEGAGDGDGD